MRRDLEADIKTLRSVLNLAQKRDFAGAAALAEKTLADGFEHPMLLNIAATYLEQCGEYQQACDLLERAVAIAPNDIGARNALGLCLQNLDRPREALFHIDEILMRHPDLAFAHSSRGSALFAMGLPEQAELSHLRAVQFDPSNFVSQAGLSTIAIQRGQTEQGRRRAQQALALAPGFPDAILSVAAAELSNGELDSAEMRLQQLVIDSRSGPIARARAAGLIGDVLDARGRYQEAFEYYAISNAAFAGHSSLVPGTNLLSYTHAITKEIERIEPSRSKVRVPDSMSDVAGHMFLVGFPRSGSSLITAVLDSSPHVVSLEDNALLARAVMKYMREPLNLDALEKADDAEVLSLQADYWQSVRAAGIETSGQVFVDKHPLNTLKLPLIAKLFPTAKFLFSVRDPRDVVLSCFRRRFQLKPAVREFLSLPETADLYAATMELAMCMKRVLMLDWHDVRGERLAAGSDGEMRGLCEFTGLSLDPSGLSQGVIRSADSHWQNYEGHLSTVLPILTPWMVRFGHASA